MNVRYDDDNLFFIIRRLQLNGRTNELNEQLVNRPDGCERFFVRFLSLVFFLFKLIQSYNKINKLLQINFTTIVVVVVVVVDMHEIRNTNPQNVSRMILTQALSMTGF